MSNRDLVDPDERELQDVTVGTENSFPYTFPFTFPIRGLRLARDPDKRTQSTSTSRDVVTFTGRDLQSG